jgi:transposase-like protein
MTNQKHGVSALGLQRLLGLGSYQTAWTILQKLRTAMVRPGRDRLHGSVEVDETYVGGIEHGVRGRGTDTKFIVVIAIEVLSPKGFGRVRLQRVNDVSGASLVPFICAAVETSSEVHTDGWKGYNGLSEQRSGTARSTFPAAEIRHTFPCLGCIALLRCSNDGCSVPTKGRLHRITWTPISTNSLSASIADTLVVEACSSSGYCNTLLSPHRRGTGRRDLSPRWKTTICRGHCT